MSCVIFERHVSHCASGKPFSNVNEDDDDDSVIRTALEKE